MRSHLSDRTPTQKCDRSFPVKLHSSKIPLIASSHPSTLTMSEPISTQISDRICAHMNEDHANAVVLYAQTYGGLTGATTAEMIAIDPQGMDLKAQVNGETVPVQIKFDRVLKDAEDAHHTLIAMIKQARAKI